MFSWLDLFTHPLLIASTLATLSMSVAVAMLGGVLLVKRASLLGETLSHAAYPGVVLGLIIALLMPSSSEPLRFVMMLACGASFACIADVLVKKIERWPKYGPDMALSVVLAAFFGLGVLFSSFVQYKWPMHFSAIPIFLFGQLATLTDIYATCALIFLALVAGWLTLYYRQIEMLLFDRKYAANLGLSTKQFDVTLTLFVAFAIVIGIRALGAVLISGMFIAPAVGARSLTKKFSPFLLTCALFGFISSLVGIYLSLNGAALWSLKGNLPTGPVVLLAASFISLICLVVAPRSGLLGRCWRGALFHWKCAEENVLKGLWKREKAPLKVIELSHALAMRLTSLIALLISLKLKAKVELRKGRPALTKRGCLDAVNIVRVHRLWELYLHSCLGVGKDKVHGIAEQVEHVSTDTLAGKLNNILKNPLRDPHNQPIPKEEAYEPL